MLVMGPISTRSPSRPVSLSSVLSEYSGMAVSKMCQCIDGCMAMGYCQFPKKFCFMGWLESGPHLMAWVSS